MSGGQLSGGQLSGGQLSGGQLSYTRLDRRLTVPSEALESSKEINFLFLRPHQESNPGCLRRRQAC